jgi:outer membrane receptor for ferrienterochelin and colicins
VNRAAAVLAIVWCGLAPAAGWAAASKPAPPGAQEGDFLDVDGVLYEVKDGKLEPFVPEGMEQPVAGAEVPGSVQKTAQTVTVTASRLETAPDSSAVNTKVVGQDEIVERGARNLADLLRQEAGIQVNGSLGTGQEVYMDGLDGRTVLILIDGRPVNGRVNNRVDVSRLPISPSMVERVEITRGPMSALYGSDAMGGVINIITKRPRQGLGGEATLDTVLLARQPAQMSLSGNLHGGKGPVTGRVALSLLRAYAYDRGGVDPRNGDPVRTPDGVGDAPGKRQATVNTEFTYRLGDFWNARAYGSASQLEVQTYAKKAVPFRDGNDNRQLTGGVLLEGEPILGHKLTLDARADRFSHFFNKLPGATDAGQDFCDPDVPRLEILWDARCTRLPQLRTRTYQHNIRLEARYEAPITIPGRLFDTLSFALGSVLEGDHATRFDGSGADTLQGAQVRGIGSVYGEVLFKPFSFLTVLPGFRADVFAPGPSGVAAAFAINPKVSTRLDLPWGFALRASYGEGFRLPSFQERFLIFDHSELGYIVQGNASLLPEKSRGARAELVWSRPHWRLSAEGFINLVNNLITETGGTTTNEAGVPIFSYANIARAYTAGANITGSIFNFYGIGVDVNYQYLFNAVDASRCPASNPYFCSPTQGATSLPLRSPHAVQFKARYTVAPTRTVLFVQANFLDARPLAGNQTAPASAVVGVGVRQPLYDHVEAFASLDNVLDSYHPTYGPKPGRSLLLSVRSWF